MGKSCQGGPVSAGEGGIYIRLSGRGRQLNWPALTQQSVSWDVIQSSSLSQTGRDVLKQSLYYRYLSWAWPTDDHLLVSPAKALSEIHFGASICHWCIACTAFLRSANLNPHQVVTPYSPATTLRPARTRQTKTSVKSGYRHWFHYWWNSFRPIQA